MRAVAWFNRSWPLGLIGGVFVNVGGPSLAGQEPGQGRVRGVIIETRARKPLEGARIHLVGTEHVAMTDNKGQFEFLMLAPGRYVIQAAAIGYSTLSSAIEVKERQTLELQFEAEAEAVNLPELTVTERSGHGPVDWLRRKSEGRGRYITRTEIERRNAATVTDMLRLVAGVRIECRNSMQCYVRMARAPRGCNPAYFMDGIPSDPAVAYLTPISEVEGIEVYSGPSETPPELESAQARCGVVVLWTRTPPPRRPKEKKPKKPKDAAADSAKADSVKTDSTRVPPLFWQ